VLGEEYLQECNLHVSSVFLSCSSGKITCVLEQNYINVFKVPEHFACVTAF